MALRSVQLLLLINRRLRLIINHQDLATSLSSQTIRNSQCRPIDPLTRTRVMRRNLVMRRRHSNVDLVSLHNKVALRRQREVRASMCRNAQAPA